ncbi:MAG: carboxypeptidase-like regulatory domain-containing protein [Acidobacteriota bacterium]
MWRTRAIAIFMTASLMVCFAISVNAQEFRGSVSGRITEASGSAVPNATVIVTNTSTNAATKVTTNNVGEFTVLYLTPGPYKVSVEAKGFKKSLREGVEIRVGDRLVLDLQLEVGGVSETVNVTSEAPLLDTASASAGQVIDRRRISDLPLSDGNPFVLTRLTPGIAYTGDLLFSRPFDNGGTSSIVADGAPGRNEFTLDGTPNMASGGGLGRVAFVPPADAVQEFKVETASFDGQTGHTAGATVNVTLRSGTNAIHGSLYEFVRNDKLSANDFFLNRTGKDDNKDGKADRTALRYNRYGGVVGGPIWLPKSIFGPLGYDGRNRTFFFFAFEGLKDTFPEPGLFTVPTLAERQGDFSALIAQGITLYDPFTGVQEGARVRRSPLTCNGQANVICASRINPVAKNFLQFYPAPNLPGDSVGRNNFQSGNPRKDTFHSESYRFDQIISDQQKFFFRYSHNNRRESRGNWADVVNGIRPIGNFLFRINDGGTFDHVYNFSPTVILNTRVGFSRFNEPSIRQHEGAFTPASLGFSAQTAALFGPELYLPRFEFRGGTYSLLGESIGGGNNHNIYSVQPTLTKIAGQHSIRMGYDFRSYRENAFGPGHSAGRYDFGADFVRGPLDNAANPTIGPELASFMLGLPTAGFIDRNAARSNQSLYHGMFVHDDFKVSRKLTLNLGLRYEFEAATDERYNRNVRGFDFTSASPIEAAVKAAYAASPIPEIPAANLNVKGGLLFPTDSNRGFWNSDKNNIQPRIGAAFQVNDKLVLRGGWGIYTVPFVIDGVQQPGFSQATNIVPTLNGSLTFVASLTNPFPNGVTNPPGASGGLATFMGRDINFFPLNTKNTQAQRWEFGFQYELPGQWLVEAAYVGNRGYNGVVTYDINPIPKQYLSTSPIRDTTVVNFLSANVTNPFRGLIPGVTLNGNTTTRGQLLRPFPQFLNINTRRNDAKSNYHSAQARIERRFSKGFTILASYTFSKFIEQASLLNPFDAEFEKRLSDADIPQRIVMSGIWELPFGRGRRFGQDWNGPLNAIAGGWQVQGIWQAQSGRPLTLDNRYYNGDPAKLRATMKGANVDRTFDASGFYFSDAAVQTNGVIDTAKQRADTRIQLTNNIRTLGSRFTGFRGQGLNLWDLSVIKNVAITESVKLQIRGEFINAFNTPVFANPNLNPTDTNFGKSTSTQNLPRNVQIGLKLVF